MVAENILIIAKQLSMEEQIRLYKMVGEEVKKHTLKKRNKPTQLISQEEAIEYIRKKCFSRNTSLY